MTDIILPRIDEDIEESSIIFWHKQEGDTIEKGEVLVEVQTEKAVSEIEAEADGILEEIIVKRGDVAKVGDTLGIIATEGSSRTKTKVSRLSGMKKAEEKPEAKQTFVRVPPRLRKLAKDLNVDLTKLQEVAKGGKITEKDIRHFADQGNSEQGQGKELTGIRRTIAKRMKESIDSTAQLTETAYADVTKLAMKRKNAQEKLSWNTWILYATIRALGEHMYMNGTYIKGKWNQSEAIHLGVATDTEEGLVVPVVENAHQYSLTELHQEVNQLVQGVQDKSIKPEKLSGSTFTVTNLGNFGIHFFTPIINPPEIAILGLGAIEKHVVLEDGEVQERMRLPLSLTFDHQIVDGAPAARFTQTLIGILENPDEME